MKSKTKLKKSTPTKTASKKKVSSGKERRRSERKDILESFHVFIVLPDLGFRKVYLKDVSLEGMGFVLPAEETLTQGQSFEFYFYINPSLRLPLKAKVVHVIPKQSLCKIGVELKGSNKKAEEAFKSFVHLLEDLTYFF